MKRFLKRLFTKSQHGYLVWSNAPPAFIASEEGFGNEQHKKEVKN